MNKPRITKQRAAILAYLASNPGASTADIDRACRTARGGHHWMYATVSRMHSVKLITYGAARPESARGGAVGVYLAGAV